MSVVVSTSRLIPGAVVCGVRGLGVKGSLIPSTGTDGPSPVYPSLSLPADANKEYRVVLVAQPSFGTVSFGDKTETLVTSLHDGQTSFSFDLYEDGVKIGTVVNQVNIGLTDVVATLLGVETTSGEVGSVTVTVSAAGVVVLLDGVESSASEYGLLAISVGQTQTSSTAARAMLSSAGRLNVILNGGLGLLTSGEAVACISTLGSDGCLMLRANGELIVIV